MVALCRGTPEQKEMAQDALNRWYWPCLMMFGPPDGDSTHSDQSTKWKIKRFSNDELRQKFLDALVPQAEFLGLTLPDPELRFEEAEGEGFNGAAPGHWRHGPIDWEEFRQILAGNGPCNRGRISSRQRAHKEGAWVREAAAAYASKQAKQKLAA